MKNTYSREEIEIFIQGSYANNTCVRGESDVDIAVVRRDIYEYAWGSSFSPYLPGFKHIAEAAIFKNTVEKALKDYFTSLYVHRKNKSIKVDGNTYRKKADTVPAFGIHHIYNSDKKDYSSYNEGITIYADDGQVINNFPKQHIKKVSSLNELAQYEKYFNGGVLWVRDTESNHKFFDDWHNNWLHSRSKGIKTDMPALALANYQNNFSIQELDGVWNCQIWFGANYLPKAKIIHYFTSIDTFSGGYGVFSVDLPKKINSGEKLDKHDWELIQNARNAFPTPNAIIVGSDYEIYRSSLCGVLRALYRKKRLFNLFEKILYLIRILRAKFII